MASSINASTTSNGIVQTADASGILQLQSDGTTALTVASGNVTVAGTITASQTAKAWVIFDGTTTPPTIKSSFNVSSVTRSATGQYVVTLTNAITDANGCVTGAARILGTGSAYVSPYMDTSSTIQVNTNTTSGALANANPVHLAVFR